MYRSPYRIPYSRGSGVPFITVFAVFFSRPVVGASSWMMTTMGRVHLSKFYLTFRFSSVATFFVSKSNIKVIKLINLTKIPTVYARKLYLKSPIIISTVVGFISSKITTTLSVIQTVIPTFFIEKFLISTSITLWGFGQKIITTSIRKYCNIRGGIRK